MNTMTTSTATKTKNSSTLLMTETSPELCRLCKDILPSHNIDVVVCPRNGAAAYSDLVRYRPDAVLLDVFMPGMDAFALKAKYEENYPAEASATTFYVTGTFQRDDIEKELMDNGFAFYFMKPFDVSVLANRITGRSAQTETVKSNTATSSTEDMVTDMLRSIGVPAHIKGYRFLRDAIMMVVEDAGLLNAVTKELYPEVARRNNTSPTRVERAIRHAIEVAWDRGDMDTLDYYFGSTIHSLRGKPTNSEFIAMLGDRCVLAQKHGA